MTDHRPSQRREHLGPVLDDRGARQEIVEQFQAFVVKLRAGADQDKNSKPWLVSLRAPVSRRAPDSAVRYCRMSLPWLIATGSIQP
jgi:hypothetical protein